VRLVYSMVSYIDKYNIQVLVYNGGNWSRDIPDGDDVNCVHDL
jgi:hypothetical protein